MKTKTMLKTHGPVPENVISNSSNKVSGRCYKCKHLNAGYAKCMKSGTCIYDLADIATRAKKA